MHVARRYQYVRRIIKCHTRMFSSGSFDMLIKRDVPIPSKTKSRTFQDLMPAYSFMFNKLPKWGFRKPRAVQLAAIPVILRAHQQHLKDEHDELVHDDLPTLTEDVFDRSQHYVIVQDYTGTGKTLAYLLPPFCTINTKKEQIQVIILVPTRELATQVAECAREMADGGKKTRKQHPVVVQRLVGRVHVRSAARLIDHPPHILICTPHTLHSILHHPINVPPKLESLQYVILDEVDHLFEPFSREFTKKCLRTLNKYTDEEANARRVVKGEKPLYHTTVAVSASVSKEAHDELELACKQTSRHQKKPHVINLLADVGERPSSIACMPPTIYHSFYDIDPERSEVTLKHDVTESDLLNEQRMSGKNGILRQVQRHPGVLGAKIRLVPKIMSLYRPRVRQVLVFVNDAFIVPMLETAWQKKNFRVVSLSNAADKLQRNFAMKSARTYKSRERAQIIVATDGLSRGMDIPYLTHVIHFDAPHSARDYLHRCGRVGRVRRGKSAKYEDGHDKEANVGRGDSISLIHKLELPWMEQIWFQTYSDHKVKKLSFHHEDALLDKHDFTPVAGAAADLD